MDAERFTYRNDGVVTREAINDRQGTHFVIATEMECEQLIRSNRAREEARQGAKDEVFRPVASIPLPLAEQMMREGWFHDDAKMKQWLNDPDNRAFRIWGGRV